MIEVELETYIELIKKHARVALKKIKKPAKYGLDDLTQEGAIVFLYTKKEYVYRGASFKTILTKRLRNHYVNLVRRSYRNKEISNTPSWGSSRMGNFLRETIFTSKKSSIDTFEIVQMSFVIDDFNEYELEYIHAVLSFTHKPRRSRRKAARETLEISYERESELRASIKDKIRK